MVRPPVALDRLLIINGGVDTAEQWPQIDILMAQTDELQGVH